MLIQVLVLVAVPFAEGIHQRFFVIFINPSACIFNLDFQIFRVDLLHDYRDASFLCEFKRVPNEVDYDLLNSHLIAVDKLRAVLVVDKLEINLIFIGV